MPARRHHRTAPEHMTESQDHLLGGIGLESHTLDTLPERTVARSPRRGLAEQQDLQPRIGPPQRRDRGRPGGRVLGVDDGGVQPPLAAAQAVLRASKSG